MAWALAQANLTAGTGVPNAPLRHTIDAIGKIADILEPQTSRS
ncbi:hypothetical protein [Pandoraea sp. 64-18]|nr:hypothetical protein [Pandoraea sp. 64-18]